MTTLPFDSMRFVLADGQILADVLCCEVDVAWPPPQYIELLEGFGVFERISFSQWSDEVAAHPNLARGALYQEAT